MRGLAMRFRGILRGTDTEKLDVWLQDADRTGLYGIRRFARSLRHLVNALEELSGVVKQIISNFDQVDTQGASALG